MTDDVTPIEAYRHRREGRRQIEVMARLRHDLSSFMVMLKDLSPGGARVEGIAGLQADQPVALSLPGRKPMLAFVAWANRHSAGLEFADPLDIADFEAIVAAHGVGAPRPLAVLVSKSAA